MLTFALFMSARMGIYQEQVYAKYGKHPGEALFYNVSSAGYSIVFSISILCTNFFSEYEISLSEKKLCN